MMRIKMLTLVQRKVEEEARRSQYHCYLLGAINAIKGREHPGVP